jgi:predicted TIM-barrel fold metal-dependent hydrolase
MSRGGASAPIAAVPGLRKRANVETMMWGSDYPHTDGIWPESSKYIEEQFAGLSPEIVRKITCENAAKFYGLIN